jgi:hypothetical protein
MPGMMKSKVTVVERAWHMSLPHLQLLPSLVIKPFTILPEKISKSRVGSQVCASDGCDSCGHVGSSAFKHVKWALFSYHGKIYTLPRFSMSLPGMAKGIIFSVNR